MQTDYIPRPNNAFDLFFRNITRYAARKCGGAPPEWNHIPKQALDELQDTYTTWYAAFALTLKPHSAVETQQRNRERHVSERALRAFVNQYLRYPPVTNLDRNEMRIPNPDRTRTPHIDVTETVEFATRLNNIREILVDFWIKGSTGKAKPHAYDGAVIIWTISGTPPARLEDLTRHTMASKTPHTLSFDETERGKTVYIALAWQNGRGNLGP
jgi:hypothetical protein